MTARRTFLGSILALGAAPAIVRADALMRVVPRETTLLLADDVSFINVDFDRDTIKAVLLYNDARPEFGSVLGCGRFDLARQSAPSPSRGRVQPTVGADHGHQGQGQGRRRPQVLTGTEGRHR